VAAGGAVAGDGTGGDTAGGGADLAAVLAERGYRPYRDGPDLRLRNCPFHTLAVDHPPLVCGMNLALLQGLLDGLAGGEERACEPRSSGSDGLAGGEERACEPRSSGSDSPADGPPEEPAGGWVARMDPRPGECCVAISSKNNRT
jgi:hypothetical protein